MEHWRGEGVNAGIAMGKLRFFHRMAAVRQQQAEDPALERDRFVSARDVAAKELQALATTTRKTLGEENAQLFQAHRMMLLDEEYVAAVFARIDAGAAAAFAVQQAAEAFASSFEALEDNYLRARAADVRDVSNRVIGILTGRRELLTWEEPCILAADDLLPSETARLDKRKVLAILTCAGSATSHTAIFARMMGIPAVVGLGPVFHKGQEGCEIIADGDVGEAWLSPDEETRARLLKKRNRLAAYARMLSHYRDRPTVTAGGRHVQLFANIGSPADMDAVLANGAEGIGLFRSEYLYLQSNDQPDERMQFEAYRSVAARMNGRPVVIRTLDLGADKRAAGLSLPQEQNPALGLRAVRVCLSQPELFRTQLRALYRASAFGKVAILFPMIASVWEVRECRRICAQVQAELAAAQIPFDANAQLGVMIETPAAALISDELAREADFFSIGTNDLSQYTLACDRQEQALARFRDPHHKAVLRLIEYTAHNAAAAGIHVGICGELGADKSLTARFLDMGIDELSVAPGCILPLRAHIAALP